MSLRLAPLTPSFFDYYAKPINLWIKTIAKPINLAKEQIDNAFVDFHSRVGDEALSLKHLSDRVANLLQDVIVDSVIVTGDADEGYLNVRLNVPGHTIISMIVDAEDTLVPVNIYYSGHLMASDVADLNDIHSMLIAVQNRNV